MEAASKQAIEDGQLTAILQSEETTEREKQRAFEALYSRHQRQLEYYFMKQVYDKKTAEDLKMITFEKVHAHIASYDDKYAFSTWMYKIALNSLIDHKRKDNFQELSLDGLSEKTSEDNSGLEFQLDAGVKTPEQEMISRQNISSVRAGIEKIKNKKVRRLMKYRYIDELSFEEIAEKEGVDKGCSTLRVSVRRGKKELKKILKN